MRHPEDIPTVSLLCFNSMMCQALERSGSREPSKVEKEATQ
jgi:hypothetical protein